MASHRGSVRSCRKSSLLVGTLLAASQLIWSANRPASHSVNGRYTATAYSASGVTQSGEYTHRHVIAADPDILPIGSRIRVRRAGKYSGEYVVADTGQKIVGRKLDIYIPSTAECRKFGKKVVQVKVLELGDGTHTAAKQADQSVKNDVAQDLQQGVVGKAATQTDWATKGSVANTPAGADAASAPPATQPKPAPR